MSERTRRRSEIARRGGILKWLVVALLVVIAVIVVTIASLDRLVKRAIESAGTSALGTQTSVRSVSISILGAAGTLKDLAIANPAPFGPEPFLTLGRGEVGVTPADILKGTIHVPKVTLDSVAISFDEKGGANNVQSILANVQKFAGSGTSRGTGSGARYVIDELVISNIVVTARTASMPIMDRGITIKVPEVKLTGIGSGASGAVSLDEMSGMIVQAVLEATKRAGQGQLPDVFSQALGNGLADLGGAFSGGVQGVAADLGKGLEGLGGLGAGLGGAVEGVGQGLEDVTKGAGDAIKKGLEGLVNPK